MRSSRFGFAAPGHAKGLCQARCMLAEAGERPGKWTAALPVQTSLELEPTSRSRGSAFVGLKTLPPSPPTFRKENRNAHHPMAARRTDCRDRPSLSLEHRLAPQQMRKPLDAQSDQELEKALAEGSLDERKEAIAKEILSRRWQAKSEAIKTNYGWFGGVLAALALTVVAVRRVLWRP